MGTTGIQGMGGKRGYVCAARRAGQRVRLLTYCFACETFGPDRTY